MRLRWYLKWVTWALDWTLWRVTRDDALRLVGRIFILLVLLDMAACLVEMRIRVGR